MSYLKIKHGDKEIELTPNVIKTIIPDLKAQFKNLTFIELTSTVSALGIDIPTLIRIIKG